MDVLQEIADVAGELADGRQHTERIPFWDGQRNKKYRTHTIVLPGLLAQLYESVIPSSAEADGARSHPASKPPLALEALSAHSWVVTAVTRWCWSLRIDLRDTVEGNVRALVGAAANLDSDTAHSLLSEMRSWRRRCAVMTGWERLYCPHVPCPVCEKVGTLRVNLSVKQAFCTNADCRADWSEETIGLLGEYIAGLGGGVAA